MTIEVENRPVDEVLYAYYKKVDGEFSKICGEQIDETDAAAVANHRRRYAGAREHARDAKYAWERARDLGMRQS